MAGSGIWLPDDVFQQTAGQLWSQGRQQVLQAGTDWAQQAMQDTMSKLQSMVPQVQAAPTPAPEAPPVAPPPEPAPTPTPAPTPPPPLPIGGTPVSTPAPAPGDLTAAPSMPAPAPTPAPTPPSTAPTPGIADAGMNWAQQQIQNLLNPSSSAPTPDTATPAPAVSPPPDMSQAPAATPTPTPSPSSLPGVQPNSPGDLIDQTRQAATNAGIDPDIFSRQIKQESGFNPNAGSPAGAQGIAQMMPSTAQGLGVDPLNPSQALPAAANLMKSYLDKYAGDWSKALAAYNAGPGAVDKAGGVPDFAETKSYIKNILGDVGSAAQTALQTGQTAVNTAVQGVQSAVARTSQFAMGLSSGDAMAFCGPAAAMAFAQTYGRNPTVDEAKQLAQQVGWSSDQGMAGPSSEVSLLKQMGIDAHMTNGVDWSQVGRDAAGGNPVILDTPGHYFYVDGYNQQTGQLHLGSSATDLKAANGQQWFTPDQIGNLGMGQVRAAIFADHPLAQQDGLAQSSASQGLTMGANQPADRSLNVGPLSIPIPQPGQTPQPMPGVPGGLVTPPGNYNPAPGSLMPDLSGAPGAATQALQYGRDLVGNILAPSRNASGPLRDQANSILQAVQDVGGQATQTGQDLLQQGQNLLQPANIADLGNSGLGRVADLLTSPQADMSALSGLIGGDSGLNQLRQQYAPSILDPTYGHDLRDPNQALNVVASLGGGGPTGGLQDLLGQGEQATTRMFHGTGSDFPSVDPQAVSGEGNLFGPGYYVTTSPEVAGGVVASGGEQVGPSWLKSAVKRPEGAVVSPGYAQNRGVSVDDMYSRWEGLTAAARANGTPEANILPFNEWLAHQPPPAAGPNVRALDVPNNLNLFDVEKRFTYNELQPLADVAAARNMPAAERVLGPQPSVSGYEVGLPTGQDIYNELQSQAGMSKGEINSFLADAGYDGITYSGGKRVPMTDAGGMPVEHQATVIFPDSVSKIRNATAGTMGGQASVPFAAGVGGAAAGGYALMRALGLDQGNMPDLSGLGNAANIISSPKAATDALAGVIGGNSGFNQLRQQYAPSIFDPGYNTDARDPDAALNVVASMGAGAATPAAKATTTGAGDLIQAARMGSLAGGIPTLAHIAFNAPVQAGLKLLSDVPASVFTGHAEAVPMEAYGALQGIRSWALTAAQTLGEQAPSTAGEAAQTALKGLVTVHPVLQDLARQITQNMELWRGAATEATNAGLPRFSSQWQAEVARLVSSPTADMQTAITAAGDRAALRGPLGTHGEWISKLVQNAPGAKFVVPFFNIGYHVASQGLETSPLGLLGTGWDVTRAAVGQGPYAGAEGIAGRGAAGAVTPLWQRLRNNLIGVGLAYEAYNLAGQGLITGEGPSDPKEQAALRDTGWQPDSLLVGGRYVDAHLLGPVGWSLIQGANAYEASHSPAEGGTSKPVPTPQGLRQPGPQDIVGDMVARQARYFNNETFLGSVGSVLNALGSTLQGGQLATREAASVIQSLIPQGALLANAASAMDPSMRETGGATPGQTIQNAIGSRLPFAVPVAGIPARQDLPARLTATGNPMPNPQQGAGLLLPRSSVNNPDPILVAMAQLGVTPTAPPTSVPYGPLSNVRLTPQEQQQWQQYRGQILQQGLAQEVSSPQWQQMGQTQAGQAAQRVVLNKLDSVAASVADKQMLGDIAKGPGQGTSRMIANPSSVLAPVYSYAPMSMTDPNMAQQFAVNQAHHRALMQALATG